MLVVRQEPMTSRRLARGACARGAYWHTASPSGSTIRDNDAYRLIWQFFEKHRR